MFNKNTYLLQQDPPNVGLNSNEILLHHHHHHQDMLSNHYLASNAPPVADPAVLYNQDVVGLNGDPSSMANACPKTAAKKDRHSKIHTAQGPRDRRVRLSIGVARKFFDLQEMLGFDKPSKTLDWLLTKSKTAIKHLVQTKHQQQDGNGNNNNNDKSVVISSLSECEENNDDDNADESRKSSKKSSDSKGKSVKQKGAKDAQHQAAFNLAKESRVKARARARERTREKMCIKQQINESRNAGYDLSPSIPIQYMNNQLDQVCRISGMHCAPQGYNHHHHHHHQEDLIQESIVINKRKVKNPSIFGFQPNYNIPSSYNVKESWDISNFASQSNIGAILDQHKFNNSSSNN